MPGDHKARDANPEDTAEDMEEFGHGLEASNWNVISSDGRNLFQKGEHSSEEDFSVVPPSKWRF